MDQRPAANPGTAALAVPDFRLLFKSLPGLVMILLPDAPHFTIATCSDAYLAATLTDSSIFGRSLFQVFPDNPDDPAADGVRNLRASLERVIASGRADAMALQKYDVARPDGSGFEEKWWSPVNTPLVENGAIRYIIHLVSDVTAEVLLKRESERQASLLTALVEAMPSGVLVADPTGKILVNNPAAQAITQMPTTDIPADPAAWSAHFGAYTPDGRLIASNEAPLERALRGETVGQHELLVRNARNGAGVHVTVAARPLLDAAGARIGALAVFTDIGERVASEKALAESEARYRQLSDNMPVIVFRCWDAPGWPMTYMSLATETITGYPPRAFVEEGLMMGTLILPEDIPGLLAALDEQLATGELFQGEYRIRHRDGSLRWIRTNSRRQTSPDGRRYYEGILADVTASKQDELLLAERAEALDRLRIAAEAGRIAPFIWQVDSNVVETVPLAGELHGLAPGEQVDARMATLLSRVHPDDAEVLKPQLAAMLAAEAGHFTFEYRTVSLSGRERWVRNACQLRRGPDGVHVIGAVLDATLEIEVQRALEERTRDTERANAELDEFTYVASHDLKEPLRGIHNYARFLAEDYAAQLDVHGQQMLRALGQQAERMQRLIEDLLHIARLGREPMQQQTTDLDEVLDEVLASLSFSLEEKKVQLTREPLGRVVCDRVRVAEVFRNLVTNALKYNDKPAPVIEIGRRVDAAGHPQFVVRDNGIGIKPEFHGRVFAPFKRLHAKEAFGGGSGVGLAIVKRIVEAHGGQIGLESEPGNGATFAFTLSGNHP